MTTWYAYFSTLKDYCNEWKFTREQQMQICKSIKRQILKGMIVNEHLLSEVFDLNPPVTIHDLQEQAMIFAVYDKRYVTTVARE